MIAFDVVLRKTEERFDARAQTRDEKAELIGEGRIIDANSSDLFERRMSRLKADPVVVRALRGKGFTFERSGPGVSAASYPRALERVLGTNNLMGIGFFERGLSAARAVALIHIVSPRGSGSGTGFMVSPRLLLTNNHVLESKDSAVDSKAEFNFQLGPKNDRATSSTFDFAPEEFFLTDPELDYTLVALQPDPRLAEFGWLRLIEETGKLLVGEWVNIIQHPNGEPKQLAIRDNQVVDELPLFLHYKADTAPGSSGSPVFNDQWEVVALHHSGVPERDAQGNILTTDRQRWEPGMGEQRIAWKANEGVRVSQLVGHIKKQRLDLAEKKLRAQMLDAEPPTSVALASPSSGQAAARTGAPELARPSPDRTDLSLGSTRAVVNRDGSATWSIPLTISVSLGRQSEASLSDATVSTPEEGLFGSKPRPEPAPTAPQFTLGSLGAAGFDWPAALSLALASDLVYDHRTQVEATALRWGFSTCRFIERSATQCFVAEADEWVLIAFRGTQGISDWLSNLDLFPSERSYGVVHAGFFEQFDDVRSEIESLLSGNRNPGVLLTGHSLGGAVATIAAAEWADKYHVRGIYTCGQPAVGNGKFSRFIGDHYREAFFRFVNDEDIVTRVPPGYRHVGRLFHFDRQGKLAAERREWTEWTGEDGPKLLTLVEFERLQANLRGVETREGLQTMFSDHSMSEYIAKIHRMVQKTP